MKTIKTHLKLIVPLLAFAALAPVASAALLVDYQFDEGSGTTADNTGTLGAVADGTLATGAGWSTNTPSGSGSSLSVDGADGSGGVSTAAALTAFNGLNTMTGVVWLNPTTVADQDRILSNQGFSGGFVGFDFQIATPNSGVIAADNYKLKLTINNDATPTSTADVTVSGWQFLAFTYDGTIATGNITFYLGSVSGSVAQLGVARTVGVSSLATSTQPFHVGKSQFNTNRAPDALFDNVQIYDTILTSGDLETIRVASVPEPSAALLIAGAGTLILVMRRRR